MVRVPKPEADQKQIHEQRQDGEQNPNRVDEQKQGGEQRRPRDERHSEGHYAERFARVLAAFAEIEKLAHRDSEQNQSARDLEIGDGNPERAENNFAEKNKTDRDREA